MAGRVRGGLGRVRSETVFATRQSAGANRPTARCLVLKSPPLACDAGLATGSWVFPPHAPRSPVVTFPPRGGQHFEDTWLTYVCFTPIMYVHQPATPMPPPRKILKSRNLTISLPEDVLMRLELYLTSTALGKVKKGGYRDFFVERIEEFFSRINAPVADSKESDV